MTDPENKEEALLNKRSSAEDNANENISQQESIEQPQTNETPGIVTPEIIDMETHAHELHKAPGHGWKHYFFEFFMLFLAVFCGFLAENYREGYVEKERAKEYTLSLYRDIKSDTTVFHQTDAFLHRCIESIDSLQILLKQPAAINSNRINFYKYSMYAFIFPQTLPNESTLQQLINSGSLRYVENSLLADSIKEYNKAIQLFNRFATNSGDFNIEFRKTLPKILDVDLLLDLFNPQRNLFNDSIPESLQRKILSDPYKLNLNADLIKEYSGWCALKKFYMENSITNYRYIEARTGYILKTIEEEYQLK